LKGKKISWHKVKYRYEAVLNPNICHDPWTPEEDRIIIEVSGTDEIYSMILLILIINRDIFLIIKIGMN
jgi:hypothetical protein